VFTFLARTEERKKLSQKEDAMKIIGNRQKQPISQKEEEIEKIDI
jgi:hypothetical protein